MLIRWLDAIEEGRTPLIFGDGLQSMDFVYVSDVARANLLALQSDVTDEVFNVGTGVQTNLNELCATLLKLSGSSLKPEYRESRKLVEVRSRQAATEKAEAMLSFRSTLTLEEGLKRLIEWRNSNRMMSAAVVR